MLRHVVSTVSMSVSVMVYRMKWRGVLEKVMQYGGALSNYGIHHHHHQANNNKV